MFKIKPFLYKEKKLNDILVYNSFNFNKSYIKVNFFLDGLFNFEINTTNCSSVLCTLSGKMHRIKQNSVSLNVTKNDELKITATEITKKNPIKIFISNISFNASENNIADNINNTNNCIDNFKEYIKNKNVIIVGPADHVDNGDFIDNFDIVVRINFGDKLTKHNDKYGTRTDIVYHCTNMNDAHGGKMDDYINKIKYLVFAVPLLSSNESLSFNFGTYSNYRNISIDDAHINKIIIIDKEEYIRFEEQLMCRPNTGTTAIWDILKYKPKLLYVTGFTLFQTKFDKNYRKIDNNKTLDIMEQFNTHDQKKISSYYNYLIDNNKIQGDNTLMESLKKLKEERDDKIHNEIYKNFKITILPEIKNSLIDEFNEINEFCEIDCKLSDEFKINKNLKDYVVTLLGYTNIKSNGSRHTNWFPWNRFYDVFKTIGYDCEWTELSKIENNKKRIFITWNDPTSLELYQSGKVNKDDIIFQKLTSLGKGMESNNWTKNPNEWCKTWNWPIYQTVEYLYDLGLNIYAFGCKTQYENYPEKKRICEKLKNRIFWITWGGTPFNWEKIKNAKIEKNNLTNDISFVGSKWGTVGRGNIDAWEKYIEPLEKCKYKFNQYGGIGGDMVSDNEMVKILKKSKICPIIHAPSWQAERGIQDRFYTVFLSGRFGICDNLGAIDIFGEEIKDICTESPKEYYNKSIYYLEHPEEQLKYIEIIQNKIKKKFNFYRQWEYVLNNIDNNRNNKNYDLITTIKHPFINKINTKNNFIYNNEGINEYFDKIFVINLKKDTNKKLKILKTFDHFNITNFEFIEAVNGYDDQYKNFFENKKLDTLWEKHNNKKHIKKKGELGCLLSHLNILKIAKERKYKKWIHFEDDVILHKNFANLFKNKMKNVPENWDILYFGVTQCYWRSNYTKELVNAHVRKANISCGTFSFAVTNKNLDFMIKKFQTMTMPADGIIVSEVQPFLNCYVLEENLIIADLSESGIRDVTDTKMQYNNFNWNVNNYLFNVSVENILKNENIRNQYNLVCNNMIDINEYANYLKGKKIAIIGPSPSCKDEENGLFIEENYDIIVRINKQWKHSKELDKYIGKRTDILYNCMDYREDCGGELDIDYLQNKIKYLVGSIKYDFSDKTHRDSQFHNKNFLNWFNYFHLKNNGKLKFINIENNFYDNYDKMADTRINTGLMGILHLLSFDIKELYIKGFTFFMDGYLLDYRDNINGVKCKNEKETEHNTFDFMINKNKNHDQEKQFKLFKKICQDKKNIIKLDEELQKIILKENLQ
jgi:GR25 family glycosyltransferase involved in LPS biosynthesis